MSLKSIQELQQMIEDLTKRVAELERYAPNLDKRVTKLEQRVDTAARAAANKSGVRR